MDKKIEDNSSTENKNVTGQDPDRYEQGYGSFSEADFDKNNTHRGKTSGNPDTEDADKANIKDGMNEDKSTISNTSSPSGDENKK